MSLQKKQLLTALSLTSLLLTGCSTIAPERSAANELMGKNIQEAYKKFGNPSLILTEHSVKPGHELYGQKVYVFDKNGVNYNQQTVVDSYMDTSSGQLVNVQQIETRNVQERCTVAFWAKNDSNVIDYYEVKGNCGLWGSGLGNTGALHYLGIN
ncbi:hypothetical protein PHLH5_25850 [Pseudomonas sp. Cab53]|uniref:hypothetical protein n=1 Tax=unclassified Pseudomonas TaxID=196821 RepID=UPI001BB322F2|nr:hypothetical protein [Pseudomonas sp. Cab53]BBP65044.1 hypothetical protein PHLH5_25850 [Pseudomonas sp. Cab53]